MNYKIIVIYTKMSADDNWGRFKFTRRFATVSGLNDMFQAVCNRI